MTAEEAARYLSEVPKVTRSFGDTLRSMRPDLDIISRLRSFYLDLDPTQNPRSVTKRLQNWLADRNPPTGREEFFRIAFALGLTEAELDYLLSIVDGYGIQYRNGREAVLTWFLRTDRTYQEADAFFETLPAYEGIEALPQDEDLRVTREVFDCFAQVTTLEGLAACYERCLDRFGTQHARAYYYFDRYLERLIQPAPKDKDMPEEQRYSIKSVMDTYLTLRMPSARARTDFTPVQKLIKQNWPNETAIKDIRAHKMDVPRKLLLLLYVVTENEGFEGEAENVAGSDIPEDGALVDRFRDHWLVLDAMLADCGMALLDMRNAFDWLVLYATAAHEDESMSERMEAVIAELYG